MKEKYFFGAGLFAAVLILVFISCGTGEYPDMKYTNKTDKPITFTTAEKESPYYTLTAGGAAGAADPFFTLASDVRGRTEITYIDQNLVTWKYKDGKDVYDIEFVIREEIKLEIRNYAEWEITLTEKKGHVLDNAKTSDTITLTAGSVTAPEIYNAFLYTKNPVWVFTSGKAPSFEPIFLEEEDKYILALQPPSGEWWKTPE